MIAWSPGVPAKPMSLRALAGWVPGSVLRGGFSSMSVPLSSGCGPIGTGGFGRPEHQGPWPISPYAGRSRWSYSRYCGVLKTKYCRIMLPRKTLARRGAYLARPWSRQGYSGE